MSQIFSQSLCLEQPLATRIFQKSTAQNKLAKAYMLAGDASVDKWRLIYELSAYLNCDKVKSGSVRSCYTQPGELLLEKWCTNCRWIEADKHPQALMRLNGHDSKSGKISVEQARAFVNEIGKTSPYFRIMVVEEANQETLHRAAANSLLKTVEEPRSQVLMIFFTQVCSDVLPTIASRCQSIIMASKQYDQYFSLSRPNQGKQSNSIVEEQSQFSLSAFDKFATDTEFLGGSFAMIENIQSLLKDEISLESILDYYISKDLRAHQDLFSTGGARYAKDLFSLGQIAKEQNKHYVSQKALVETFVYAWHRLKTTGSSPLKIQW